MEEPDTEINLRVLVACTGNIHRSPFAQVVLRKTLEEARAQDTAVESAGLQATEAVAYYASP